MEANFDLVKRLLDLPWYNLILISLLIVPIFIGAWVALLNSLSISLSDYQRKGIALSFMIIYAVGLTIGKVGHDNEQERKNKLIVETLTRDLEEAGGLLGFERIRFKHPSYDNETLYSLAESHSDIFSIQAIGDAQNPGERDKNDPIGLKLRNWEGRKVSN